ncbi:MAG: TadE family protein, partial [Anaerolineae bacterium]|nr:TadE family protein [Anaerolineae bacterium]
MFKNIARLRQRFGTEPQSIEKAPNQKGQSLVEMAITLPLLLLMFVGVFEVGWAVRSYVVLTNVNRETARFAAKNTELDFSKKDPEIVGYTEVMSHTLDSLSEQLGLELEGADPNGTVIMSHFVIDTALPCARYQGNSLVVPYEFDP